jgi:2-polyprenyl-3-methyl-5-hydroxy-6-metoxy-1,4-benzoquinol methylase
MAMRGAEVVAVDLSPNLPKVARARATAEGAEADRLQRRRPAVR